MMVFRKCHLYCKKNELLHEDTQVEPTRPERKDTSSHNTLGQSVSKISYFVCIDEKLA